jgi:hypothetical protein
MQTDLMGRFCVLGCLQNAVPFEMDAIHAYASKILLQHASYKFIAKRGCMSSEWKHCTGTQREIGHWLFRM